MSVSSYGLSASCGNTITRDNSEPSKLDARFDTRLAQELDIPTPLDLDTAPFTKCTDALTLRRWIAWPAVLVGIVIAFAALRKLTWTRVARPPSRGQAHVSASTVDSHAQNSAQSSPQPVPNTAPGHAPLPLAPAGWYQDPHQGNSMRWFDGSQWTAGTAPGTQSEASPSQTERGTP
ncbi:DUF2510 domain-containing protein [Rhodococcus sp. BP22]|uniref:DUF2510 domain-containing protein n=1 Tax=Rhodococcus sp. BP22 TaxID=2758566 RepID=UPI0037CB0281